MRIAVFHDLPSGGAKRALREQVTGLRARGHRVDVFLPSTAEDTLFPTAGLADRARVFPRRPPPDREAALEKRFAPGLALRWAAYLVSVRRSERTMAHAIDGGRYDVALVHPNQITQAPYVLRDLGTPSIYYCHEPLRAAYEPRIAAAPTRFVIRQTLGRIDRANVRGATAVAANSKFTAGRTRRIYGRSARVVYLGVDADRFRPLSVERGSYLLTVGALHPLKGLDFVVDAVGRLPSDERPPLVIVSDRARVAERRRLQARATAAGTDLRFRFRVEEEELVELYNRARLVLYAPHREPFGFVPLEAMACGRPVLAVREGGVCETIIDGETGFGEIRDTGRFAARILTLLRDREATERVADRASEIVRQRWRWDLSVARLEALAADTAAGSMTTMTEDV